MAKRSRKTDTPTVTRYQNEGRGTGSGAHYKPWLTVQDVPSQGLSHRIKGWTTGRLHHLFSNLERDVFYLLDWSLLVTDIREQYPLLPLEETETIATRIGVRHPRDPRTQASIVMTTDFLLDVETTNGAVQQARTVKPTDQLDQSRVLEKLEIERQYWEKRGVDWGIITEREIPQVQVANIRLLHGYHQIEDRFPDAVWRNEIIQFLLDQPPSCYIGKTAADCDRVLQLQSGTALTVLYHLLATQQIAFTLGEPLTDHTELLPRQAVPL